MSDRREYILSRTPSLEATHFRSPSKKNEVSVLLGLYMCTCESICVCVCTPVNHTCTVLSNSHLSPPFSLLVRYYDMFTTLSRSPNTHQHKQESTHKHKHKHSIRRSSMSRALLDTCRRRHLVLHMDINKTIIQTDVAGGRSFTDVLNSNVAANVFGVVEKDAESGSEAWRPLFSVDDTSEAQHKARMAVQDQPIMTFADYVDRKYTEPTGMASLSKAERDVMWKQISGERRKAVRDFTFPGAVGEAYAALVEKQRRALTRPGMASQVSSAVDAGEVEDKMMESARYHTIIPSFFHLINTLSEMEWPFTLIFRTFGNDLERVLKDWQSFIRGQHVCRPSGATFHAMAQLPLVTPLTACVYREHDRLFLCYGPNKSASTLSPDFVVQEKPSSEEVLAALRDLPGYHSAKETTFHTLQQDLKNYFAQSANIGGLVDYYPCWAQAAEHRDGGKVFAVKPVFSETTPANYSQPQEMQTQQRKQEEGEEEDEEVYTVFFDDNISLGDVFSIVDIRDATTGASICDAAVESLYCVPVNAYKAIVDKDYFVACLGECISKQDKAMHAARERKRKRESDL